MSYLGLTCSEYSSGQKEYKDPITKTGNKRVRRLLIETCWHYRQPYATTSKQLRKCYWHLVNNGKMPCKATVAVAKELAGFIWSVFKEYESRSNMKAA